MASVLSLTRERVRTILATVTGLTTAGQIVLGTKDFAANVEFLNTIVTNGPFVVIGKPARDRGQSGGIFEWTIPIKYFAGYADDADNDYKSIDDTLELAMIALNNMASYTDCYKPFQGIETSEPEELSEKPRVVMHEITLRGMGSDA